jgi:hypothetical protein
MYGPEALSRGTSLRRRAGVPWCNCAAMYAASHDPAVPPLRQTFSASCRLRGQAFTACCQVRLRQRRACHAVVSNEDGNYLRLPASGGTTARESLENPTMRIRDFYDVILARKTDPATLLGQRRAPNKLLRANYQVGLDCVTFQVQLDSSGKRISMSRLKKAPPTTPSRP